MIVGYSPVIQALLGTLFTWAVTAAGSAMVFVFKGYRRSFLDGSLGFAAGVMIAASFWSLLLPALEISERNYNSNRAYSCVPVTIGFLIGALFVYLTDKFLPDNYLDDVMKNEDVSLKKQEDNYSTNNFYSNKNNQFNHLVINTDDDTSTSNGIRSRMTTTTTITTSNNNVEQTIINENIYSKLNNLSTSKAKFRKILLLIIAVTVHNIPEGLAVGVGFGAIGHSPSATFESARNLAFGIGLQNFPEGLAVSLPLYASGFSYWKSFWYGQLSGMVEPLAGLIGALTIKFAQSILPYALAFAAGAMIFVVCDNIIPEAASNGNNKLSSWCCMIGFCVMMCLDVSLS